MIKRRNLLVIIITLMFVCVFLTGCDDGDHDSAYIDDDFEQETETQKEIEVKGENVKGLVYVETIDVYMGEGYKDMTQTILYDPKTNIMFSAFWWGGDCSVVQMCNPDGSPRIYNPN
jgi:hypothetical protein